MRQSAFLASPLIPRAETLMPPEAEHRATPTSPRNGYFVIHASVVRRDGEVELNGMMEDLTTGEKQVFDSAAAVTRLMEAWAARETAPHRKQGE